MKKGRRKDVLEESQPDEHHLNAAINDEIGKSKLFRKETPPEDVKRKRRIKIDSQPEFLGEDSDPVAPNPSGYTPNLTEWLLKLAASST
jgi:hypothetical protein